MNQDFRKRIGQRIVLARKSAGMTQVELAEAIGLTDKAISAYEQGRATPPLDKFIAIAEATGASWYFLGGDLVNMGEK